MTVVFGIAQAAAITAGTTQSITDATGLGGLTPKWAICVTTYATINGTAADHAVYSIGITDGTTMFSKCFSAENGVGTSDTELVHSTDQIISLIDVTGSAAWEARANLSGGGMIANGITINWSNLPSSAYQMQWFFCAGTDVNAAPGTDQTIEAVTKAFSGLGLGGVTQLVMMLSAMTTSASNTIGNQARQTIGVSDGTNSWSLAKRAQNNQSTTQAILHTGTTDAADSLISSGVANSLNPENFGSSSFDLNPDTDWDSRDASYLALRHAGAGIDIQSFDTPGSATTKVVTGLGFEPAAGILLFSRAESRNADKTNNQASSFGVAFFDGTTELSAQMSTRDNVGTTETFSYVNTKALDQLDQGGAVDDVAVVQSVDADGWTFDFTASDTVHNCILISFEGVSGAPPTGRIMSSLAASGGLAYKGGIAGSGGGLAG